MHRIFWFLGFVILVTVALLIGHFATRENDNITAFKLPIWVALFPSLVFVLYVITVQKQFERTLKKERLEHKLSGMEKKEYLNYKAGDDRATKGFLGSATSATILASSNVLSPYFRYDTRP